MTASAYKGMVRQFYFQTKIRLRRSGNKRKFQDRIDGQIKLWDEMLISSISANQALKKEGITGEKLANRTSNNVQEMARDRYWYPQMSNTELAYVRRIAKHELTKTDNYIDNDNKWLYNVKNGNTYFALYSTADVNEPTILYACKNTRAEKEYAWFMGFIEELRSVDNGDYEQSTGVLNQMLEAFRNDYGSNNRSIGNGLGRRSNLRNVRTTNQRTDFRPCEALLDCLKNIGDIQKRNRLEQYSDRDTLGNTLTEAQQSYFAESKVRDENGTLKVMYRGDSNAFTVFDRKKTNYANLYGRGFYFTERKEHAEQYGESREFYLNIKTPLSPKQNNITKSQMLNFLKTIENDGEDYDLYNYGEDATAQTVLNSVWGKGDYEMLQDISAGAIGDLVATVEWFNQVNGTAYDGIILPTETIIFNSEQAKLITNENPTSDPDIRYSDRDNLEIGNEDYSKLLSKKAINVSKEIKAKIGSQRTTRYGDVLEEDIPILDYFRVADYNKVNVAYRYTIRNDGKYHFSVIRKQQIKPQGVPKELNKLIQEERENARVDSRTDKSRNGRYDNSFSDNRFGHGRTIQADDGLVANGKESDKERYNGEGVSNNGRGVKFSDRDNVSVYDTMGETDRLIKENEQLKEDVERLKKRLKLERQITNGNHFNENQLDAVAGHIRNIVISRSAIKKSDKSI